MADNVEMQDIRGLKIEKMVKGFALAEYIFKNYVSQISLSEDQTRWYKETAADLTTTAPQDLEVAPTAKFTTLQVSWTRNNSYMRKWGVEGFISNEDISGSDIDPLRRTVLRLTRAIVKAVDTRIWNVISESQSASTINSVTTTSVGGDQWDAASAAGHPLKDILRARRLIEDNNYNASNAICFVSPKDRESIINWIYDKGAQAQMDASTALTNGTVQSVGGVRLVTSINVTADYALVMLPNVAATWYTLTGTSSKVIDEPGIGKHIRVWEAGECVLTDPGAVTLIDDTQT